MAMTVPADSGGARDAGRIQSQCYWLFPGGWARALIYSAARDVERDAEGHPTDEPARVQACSHRIPRSRTMPMPFIPFMNIHYRRWDLSRCTPRPQGKGWQGWEGCSVWSGTARTSSDSMSPPHSPAVRATASPHSTPPHPE